MAKKSTKRGDHLGEVPLCGRPSIAYYREGRVVFRRDGAFGYAAPLRPAEPLAEAEVALRELEARLGPCPAIRAALDGRRDPGRPATGLREAKAASLRAIRAEAVASRVSPEEVLSALAARGRGGLLPLFKGRLGQAKPSRKAIGRAVVSARKERAGVVGKSTPPIEVEDSLSPSPALGALAAEWLSVVKGLLELANRRGPASMAALEYVRLGGDRSRRAVAAAHGVTEKALRNAEPWARTSLARVVASLG